MTGREFARRAGWGDATNVTKIEKGQRGVTANHVHLWCDICGAWCDICGAADRRRDELLAEQRQLASMWQSYRERVHQHGVNPTQKMLVGDLFERLSVMFTYQTKVIPGLLQTRAYMTGVLAGVREERHLAADDVAEAVDERFARQRHLRRAGKRFAFIVEEHVIRHRTFGDEVHAEQMTHLLETTRLPSVTFGIIPIEADRHGYRVRESFDIIDGAEVQIELISGFLSLTHPVEVAMYTEAWEHLSALAVYGRPAEVLLRSAMAP